MDITLEEILRLRDMAEHTGVQFKERVTKENKSEVAAEMVAMSNTRGGMVVVGIDDKTGSFNPLSYKETQEVTALLGNLANDNVIPSILVDIENVPANGGVLVVATIKQGLNKPYHDNNGVVWVKQGADKRKVFDNEVSTTTLSEVVVNCILHRSYAADSPLRIFIFENRIEIHSPGLLPQGVTVEDATHGVSVPRNKLLFSNGIHLLPYTGAGSGLTRAQLYTPNIKFENDERLKEFVVTIWRDSAAEISEIYDRVHDRVHDRVGEDKSLIQNELLGDGFAVEKTDDRASGEVYDRVPYRLLEPIQKNIIQYCSVPRSAREILEHINYKYHPDAIAKMLKPLLSMGYLEFTIPDKPNSPKQKYRKK